jgi:hypothetical protein
VGAALAACTLTTDLGGLSGAGAHDAGALPDARSGEDGAPSSDSAPVDASSGETTPTADWCAAQDAGYRLCSDFDRPGDGVTQGFDLGLIQVPNSAGGSFQIDPSAFVSPPNGVLGRANPFPAGGVSGTRLVGTLWALGPTPQAVLCTVAWNPQALSTTANDYAHVIEIVLYSSALEDTFVATFSVNMQGDGSLILLEYYPLQPSKNATHTIPVSVVPHAWIPVRLSIGNGNTFDIAVGDGHTSGALAVPLPSTSHGTLEVGPAYFAGSTTASSPGWLFGFDNAICY